MLINQFTNAVFQVFVFSLIPFIWWLITARKKENFLQWIGLRKPEIKNKKRLFIMTAIVFIGCLGLGELAIGFRGPMEAADSPFKGMGWIALPSILVYSFIQTAFSEEILFRGFLLKRLSLRFGFIIANIIQAFIFGSVHILMVWGHVDFLVGTIIVLYPMIVAVGLSYLNEKEADGSILPSWFVHGLLNTCSALFVLF